MSAGRGKREEMKDLAGKMGKLVFPDVDQKKSRRLMRSNGRRIRLPHGIRPIKLRFQASSPSPKATFHGLDALQFADG